jgi:hypothetical protein
VRQARAVQLLESIRVFGVCSHRADSNFVAISLKSQGLRPAISRGYEGSFYRRASIWVAREAKSRPIFIEVFVDSARSRIARFAVMVRFADKAANSRRRSNLCWDHSRFQGTLHALSSPPVHVMRRPHPCPLPPTRRKRPPMAVLTS